MIIERCSKCGERMAEDYIVSRGDEKLVCSRCAKKHLIYLINNLEEFRKNNSFDDKRLLIRKLFWIADETEIEVYGDEEFYKYNIFELQVIFLNDMLGLFETYFFRGGIERIDQTMKEDPKLSKIRLDVLKQRDRISTYINREEFIFK